MHKKIVHSLSFCAALLVAASAARADCVQNLDKFEASFNERLKTESVKAAEHPLILKLADGKLVDMRGEEPDAKPTERWFVTDMHALDQVRTGIDAARKANASGDAAGCESGYSELQKLVN